MEAVVDLTVVLARILATVELIQDTNKPTTGDPVRAQLDELYDFRGSLRSILQDSSIDKLCLDAPGLEVTDLRVAKDIIARDTILRIETSVQDALQDGISLDIFNRAWSEDSISILKRRIGWLREEAQSNLIATDSRVLWTGPLQRHQQNDSSDMQSFVLSVRAKDRPTDLVLKIEATLSNIDRVELIREFFLERLTYTNITGRAEDVPRADHETFEWVFSKGSSSFVAWLNNENQSQIYWINGKAGSGKSTLMRFVVEHAQTTEELQKWAGSSPLYVLKFFFWTSGSLLQRSQIGLLRSLLFQILYVRPELIPWTFPELWMACQDTRKRISMIMTWETEELLQALRRAFEWGSKESKLCLFIDGLDEFQGDESVIIALVRDIVGLSPNIKACISSRPWTAFEQAFDSVPHMLLQDLTRTDMSEFILSRMKENECTLRMIRHDPAGFQEVRSEMLQRAEGVFLWTSLVLRALLAVVVEGSTMQDVSAYLTRLPSDLEDLFAHLLFNNRTPDVLRRQSHAFQIVRARNAACNFTGDESVRDLTIYQMALAHEGKLHQATGREIFQADPQAVLNTCETCEVTLEEECANFLVAGSRDDQFELRHAGFRESSEPNAHLKANRKISYLHRTVSDFLQYSGTWSRIVSNGAPQFDPHQALMLSHVLRLRLPLDPPQKHRRLDEWWHDDVILMLTHARFASPLSIKDQVYLLDLFNTTLDSLWKKKWGDPQDTWARNAFGSYEDRMKNKTPFHDPFLSLAAKFGLAGYLRIKLADENFAYKAGIPLLSHTLDFLIDRRKTVYPLCSEDVVAVLLEAGQSPNQPYLDMSQKPLTPWLLALRCVREALRRGWIQHYDIRSDGVRRWVKIMELMLQHGADHDAMIVADKWDPEASALSIISAVEEKYFSSDVHRLRNELIVPSAK